MKLNQKAKELFEEIRQKQFNNVLVNNAIQMQRQQKLNDFEMVILLCYQALNTLDTTQKEFVKYMQNDTRPIKFTNSSDEKF